MAERSQPRQAAAYRAGGIRDLASSERPQERLQKFGAESLSDRELLAMLLRSGTRERDVLAVADDIFRQAGSLSRLLAWNVHDFMRIHGVGKIKALQFLAIIQVAKRILAESDSSEVAVDTPEVVYRSLRAVVAGLEVEKFWVFCLNRKNRLLRREEVSSGTASSALVHPREVFRPAIRNGASAVIVAHNHPSGDPAPSRADIQVTRQLRDSAAILGIEMLDHVVVGSRAADPTGKGFYSFNDAGLV